MAGDISPFVWFELCKVVICKECQFACVANEVDTHLLRHKLKYSKSRRNEIAEQVQSLPGIFRTQDDLENFQFPDKRNSAIPYLGDPYDDGIACDKCPLVFRHMSRMKRHYKSHDWDNPRKRGRVSEEQKKNLTPNPWRTGVRCQQFFPSRKASHWFEVERQDVIHGESSSQLPARETAREKVFRLTQEQRNRFEQTQKVDIQIADDRLEPNLWVQRVGWAHHLQGKDRNMLLQAIGPVQENEPVLRLMCDSLVRVIRRARFTVRRRNVGFLVLQEVNRKDGQVQPRKPFNGRMEKKTWLRYTEVMAAILRYIVRTQNWPDKDRPPYELTDMQCDLFDAFEKEAERMDNMASVSETDLKALDRLCLDMMVQLMDQEFRSHEYESVVLSAMAVMGLHKNGSWVDAREYTGKYSAVIKCVRLMIVEQAVRETQDEIREKQKTMDADTARQTSQSVYQRTRNKVYRFMVQSTMERRATPIDWIYSTRSFGLKIQYTTVEPGKVDWQGDQVRFQKAEFTMEQMCDMVRGLVTESQDLMGRLLMMPNGATDIFPTIDWAKIVDDHGESRPGYSFLTDERNQWPVDGQTWLLEKITREKTLTKTWLSRDDRSQPFRTEATKTYGRTIDEFRERLLLLMHLTGGQPARAPEILGMRYHNTPDGGIRNIFIHDGLVSFVTIYHKNIRTSERIKLIHRYLPREVGALLVWYLWLVLPFWQQVQGIMIQADKTSPFLWAEHIVSCIQNDKKEAVIDILAVDKLPEDDYDIEDDEEYSTEQIWKSDRLRRIFQQNSERLLGTKLNISMWRHITAAIVRKYLGISFEYDKSKNDNNDDDSGYGSDSDDEVDMAHLQAGHTAHTAGMVYGLELQQGDLGTVTRRDQFRKVSIRWHRFLTLGDRDNGAALGKRRREVWELVAEETRLRRFKRLYQINIQGKLEQMFGVEAQFRGKQESVIRAILHGHEPILQIAGTGEGKSLSFMLPAFCSDGEGVTIVIVPLVALEEDLVGRCHEHHIDAYVWTAGAANRAAPIVFVTPESAVTGGFADFVNRLRARQQLDRVVVDECHMLLDSTDIFRPKMRKIGPMIKAWGVQRIFLTATLPLLEEGDFFKLIETPKDQVEIFRGNTSRKNIKYQVKNIKMGEELNDKIYEEVERLKNKYVDGKIIVYGQSIERVKELSTLLECPTYYNDVGSAKEKRQIMKEWLEYGRVIMATNALGAGIDVPDVRAVVHAGCPRKLRNHVQESGRGGRDGMPSESILWQGSGWDSQAEADMKEFTDGGVCRRLVLDEAMDGRVDRISCEEGEERCDVCEKQHTAMQDTWAEATTTKEEAEAAEGFYEMQRGLRWSSAQERTRIKREAGEILVLRERLEDWRGCCVCCRIVGLDGFRHEGGRCGHEKETLWMETEKLRDVFWQELFGQRRMERFGGCQYCGIPQSMCQRWEKKEDDGGRFGMKKDGKCQYGDMAIRVIAGLWVWYGDEMKKVVTKVMEEDGRRFEVGEKLAQWLGGRRRWGGIECNNLIWLFFKVLNEWVE